MVTDTEKQQLKCTEMIDLLLGHSSVRTFTKQPVSEETVDTIITCAQMAPTSSYLQAYSIIRVTDSAKRAALMEFSGGQTCVQEAPLVLLFCADLHRLETFAKPEDGNVLHNTELYTVAVIDAALAAQKALIAAQALGLGGVPVGGVRNETEKMAELFELPDFVFPMFLLCLGYPQESVPVRPRLPKPLVYGEDCYPNQNPALIDVYDESVRQYFLKASAGKSDRVWTERCRYAVSRKPRYELGAFLKKAGFMTEKKAQEKEQKHVE